MQASWVRKMARALPGQIADTSLYQIDGACVLDGDKDVLVGVGVQFVSKDKFGDSVVKAMSTDGHPYGVGIRSHFQTTSKDGRMVYEVGSGINVMTEGRVWMVCEDKEAQQYGTAVKLNAATGAVKKDGEIVTSWIYTGDITQFQDLTLVEVQLMQS